MKEKHKPVTGYRLIAPRYWPTWLAIALFRLIALLPFRLQLAIGRWLGRILQLLSPYRRTIVRTNLELCFPELNTRERQQLENRFYQSLGMSITETAAAMWGADSLVNSSGSIEGLEHITAAQQQGKGVLLLSGHFCSLDFAGKILLSQLPVCFTFQELRNKLFDRIIRKAREKSAHKLIHRQDLRGFIRTLKSGEVVWYAPDQDQARKNSVFAPFFGIPANTLTATTKLVKLTGAAVLPFHIRRLPDSKGYALTIEPPLENFPGASEVEDATRFNAIIESQAREHPEQYLWIHRRFKTRPVKGEKIYPQKPRRIRKKRRMLRKNKHT